MSRRFTEAEIAEVWEHRSKRVVDSEVVRWFTLVVMAVAIVSCSPDVQAVEDKAAEAP